MFRLLSAIRRPMGLLVWAIVLTLSKNTIAGDCPTKADIETGIVLERSGRTFISGFKLLKPGVVQELRLDDKRQQIRGIRTEYTGGIAATRRVAPDSDISILLDSLPNQIIPLELGGKVHLVGEINNDNQIRADIRILIENIGSEIVTIGRCAYNTIVVDQITNVGNGWNIISFRQYFSPELGFVLKAQRLVGPTNKIPVTEVRYDRISRKVLGDPT